MTVPAHAGYTAHTASGSSADFTFGFAVLTSSELEVRLDNVIKTESTHYTVAINGSSGGTVSFVSTPTANQIVSIRRVEAYEQLLDLVPNAALPAAALETRLDKIVKQIQRINEELSRRPATIVGSPAAHRDWVLPTTASGILAINSDSTGLTTVSSSDTSPVTDPALIDDLSGSLAAFRTQTDPGEVGTENLPTTLKADIERLRYAVYDAKKATDNSITYWYETPPATAIYNVKAHGATGDGTTDDYAALNTLFTAVNTASGGVVYFPQGTYRITNTLRIPSNTLVYGEGPKTIIKMDTTMTTSAFENWGQNGGTADSNITLRDLYIDGNRTTPAGALDRFENIYQVSTAFTAGMYVAVTDTSSLRIYLCQQSGTTGAASIPTGNGTGIADNTVIWDYVEDLWTEKSIPGGHQAGVLFSRVTNPTVENISVYMSRDNGVIFELCYHAKIQNCHFRDINKNGIYFSNNEHSRAVSNSFTQSYSGIAVACDYYGAYSHNTGEYIMNHFISVGRDCRFCAIVGNVGGTSLPSTGGLANDADFLVTAESITGTAHGATYPGSSGDYLYGIKDSVIADNVFTRMQLQLSDRNVIANNVVHNARRDGIHILGCAQCTVIGNRVINGGSQTLGPWAFSNNSTTGGALQGTVQSVQNNYLYNEVYDDRNNNGLIRWGFTFGASSAYLNLIGNMVYLDPDASLAIRYYNWGSGYGVFRDNYYDGTNKFIPEVTLPSSRAELRGELYTVNGGAGVLDRHYLFQKNAADAFDSTEILPMTAKTTFTVTGTGFAANPTGTAAYQVVGGIVHCYIPALTGTSNATTFTLTGMPAAITPGRNSSMPVYAVDNGVEILGRALLTASSTTITLYAGVGTTAWTNAGTKTLHGVMLKWDTAGF